MEKANNKTGLVQISLKNKLDWTVDNLERSVKKASYMANSMAEDYYLSDKTETEEDKERVLYNHHFACVGHGIILDYLDEARGHIKTLTEIINKMSIDTKEGVTDAKQSQTACKDC